MVDVKIESNVELFDKAKKILSNKEIASACRMALNEGANRGRVMVGRAIQDVYNIKASRINDDDPKKGVTVRKASDSNLNAYINTGHSPVGFANLLGVKLQSQQTGQEFSLATTVKRRKAKTIKGRKLYAGGGISIEVFKGQRKVIPSAFIIGSKNSFSSGRSIAVPGKAVFARGVAGKPGFKFGKERMPIAGLSSVSIATAAHNTKAAAKYGPAVNMYASGRFVHHLQRLISAVEGG